MNMSVSRTLFHVVPLLIAGLMMGFTCEKNDSPVIARVGRAVLTLEDLNKRIPQELHENITNQQRINYVKKWIDTELLYQAALNQKIDKEPVIKKRLEQMKKDLLGAEMISRNSASAQSTKISEEAILNYYQEYKGSFIRESDVVKYIELVVDDLKTAWNVRNLISESNFFEIASKYSKVPVQDPLTASFIAVEDLPPEFSSVLFSFRIQGTTNPIALNDDYHIVRIIDKRKAGDTCSVEEVREEIISTLSANAQKRNIEFLLADLRQKIDHEFHFELLGQQLKGVSEKFEESEMLDSLDDFENSNDTINSPPLNFKMEKDSQ